MTKLQSVLVYCVSIIIVQVLGVPYRAGEDSKSKDCRNLNDDGIENVVKIHSVKISVKL
jgi:hypothetical protein